MPSPIEGSFFKAAWLKTFSQPAAVRDARDVHRGGRCGDRFGKGRSDGDRGFALDPAYIFVLDLWRHQAGAAISVDALLDMARDWKPIVIVTESGQLKNALFLFP
jgi:hypothetical protein